MGNSRLAQTERTARGAISDWALHGGNLVARFDGDEYEAFVRLAEIAGKRCEEDSRIYAISLVERLHAPVSQGIKKSRLVALMRVMPGGPGEPLVLLPGEEITAIIAPKKMVRPGKELFAEVRHDEDCPQLEPKAEIASCRCSPDVEVRERDAVN